MKEDIGNTKERPVLRSPRRRQGETVHGQISERDSSSRPRSTNNARNTKRPNAKRPNAQHSASKRTRHQSNESRRAQGRTPRKRSGVPIVVVILLMLITGTAAVFITRATLTPQIEKAQQETANAKSQIATLTKQLDKASGSSNASSSSSSTKDETTSSTTDSKKTASTQGVEDPWVESGTVTTGDSVLDGEVKAFCDSIADKSKMDQDTALLEVYKGVAWSEYVERAAAQKPSGKNWRIEFARMYYENGCSGNCYEFAAFLSYCMQYLGLSDATAQGVLIEMQAGDWGDHGIVYVTNTDGSKCLCDTAMGTNGYMLPESTYNIQMQDFENA